MEVTTGTSTIYDFGAVGDGRTDDAPALQRAILNARGPVYFPAGVYLCRSPLVVEPQGDAKSYRNINWFGAGTHIVDTAGGISEILFNFPQEEKFGLALFSAMTCSFKFLAFRSASLVNRIISVTAKSAPALSSIDILFEGVSITPRGGPELLPTEALVVVEHCFRTTFRRCWFNSGEGTMTPCVAIRMGSTNDKTTLVHGTATGTRIEDCTTSGSFELVKTRNTVIDGVQFIDGLYRVIRAVGESGNVSCVIQNCTFGAMHERETFSITLDGYKARPQAPADLSSGDFQIVNNLFYRRSGIYVRGRGCLVKNNVFVCRDATQSPITIDEGATGVRIEGNTFRTATINGAVSVTDTRSNPLAADLFLDWRPDPIPAMRNRLTVRGGLYMYSFTVTHATLEGDVGYYEFACGGKTISTIHVLGTGHTQTHCVSGFVNLRGTAYGEGVVWVYVRGDASRENTVVIAQLDEK